MTEDAKSVVIQNLGDVTAINKLHISIAELSRDMIHMSSCFQEMNARLEEFMKNSEERVRALEQGCKRDDHELIWNELRELDCRMNAIERAKCPKTPVLNDLDERLTAQESIHHQDTGANKSKETEMNRILFWVAIVEGIIIAAQAFHIIS